MFFKLCSSLPLYTPNSHLWCRWFLNNFLSLLFATRILAICHWFIHIINIRLMWSPIMSTASIALIDSLNSRLVTSRLPIASFSIKVSSLPIDIIIIVAWFIRLILLLSLSSICYLSIKFTVFTIIAFFAVLSGWSLSKIWTWLSVLGDLFVIYN